MVAPDHLDNTAPAVAVAISRIVEEELTNVMRHSGASRCIITIVCCETEVKRTIEDD